MGRLGLIARILLAAALGVALGAAGMGGAAAEGPRPRPALAALPLPAVPARDPQSEIELFAMPRVADSLRLTQALVEAGAFEEAEDVLDGLIARYPGLAMLYANRAALAMLAGAPQDALAGLEAAAAHGLPDLPAIAADPIFAPLGADPGLGPRFAALQAPPPPVPGPPPPDQLPPDQPSADQPPPDPLPASAPSGPVPILDGRALVSGANTRWNPVTERLEPRFDFPDKPGPNVLPPGPKNAAGDLLREHWRRGRAAGNHGDLYDNRDRGHSTLDPKAFPQLSFVAYSPIARAADTDYALNDRLTFDHPTFGNSSTAITAGAEWRSLPRLALTKPDGTGPMRLWQNAAANALYIYPSHKDYSEDLGDLFPANTPYILISHGSSGSDQPFLQAVAMILASFRPATKAKMVETGTLVSTLQMVFRRSLQNVTSREMYLSGDANPVVFEPYNINLARMVSLAQSITPETIPAQVHIRMLAEDASLEGVDFFGQGLSEQLFDTPQAIARIWRSAAYSKTFRLSAADSRDVNGHPLRFDWRLLQGDPAHVRITPSDDGQDATIEVDWQEPRAISDENPIKSPRIDIGVFAHNGQHDSAPAIFSIYCPPHEARRYAPGPDGQMHIAEIDHAARPDAYADPVLVPRADWRDSYQYDAAGQLLGWTRHRDGSPTDFDATDFDATHFDSGGRRLLDPATGRAEAVAYPLSRDLDGTLIVEEVSAAFP